jgi:hypothetical protein
MEVYPGHSFADDLSIAMACIHNRQIQLEKLSLFSEYTGLNVNAKKCSVTGELWHNGSASSKTNKALLDHRLSLLTADVNKEPAPLPTPSKTTIIRSRT